MEAIALGIYVQDDAPGRVDRHGRGGRIRADRVLQAARRRARRPLPRKALLISTTWSRPRSPGSSRPVRDRRTVGALVTLIAFGNGICAALGFPAFQAMLPDLVPVEDLPGAIALSSAQYNLGRVVGPALAGIVIALGGYACGGSVNAVSFLAVVAVLLTLTLPVPARRARPERSALDPAGSGSCAREPGLRVNVAAMCVNTFLAAPFIALVPAMAHEVLDSGPAAPRCSSPRKASARCDGVLARRLARPLGSRPRAARR